MPSITWFMPPPIQRFFSEGKVNNNGCRQSVWGIVGADSVLCPQIVEQLWIISHRLPSQALRPAEESSVDFEKV